MGIGLEQWRRTIGLYNGKRISNINTSKCRRDFLILCEFLLLYTILVHCLPIQLLVGMVKVFAFSFMVTFLVPLISTSYLFYYLITMFLLPSCDLQFSVYILVYNIILILQIPKALSRVRKLCASSLSNIFLMDLRTSHFT